VEARLLGTGPGWDGCFRIVLGVDAGPVVGLELARRYDPDLAVKASVVESVDVRGDGDLDVGHRLPAAPGTHDRVADAVGLEQLVSRVIN
jgi:hypothetical protein